MSLKIDRIVSRSEPIGEFNLIKTTFETDGKVAYMFTKADNVPNLHAELDGDLAPDKYGKLKFTKTKLPPPGSAPQQTPKVYKADPDKMAQEKTLEIAKNKAIMRQVAVKAVTDLTITLGENYDKAIFRARYVDIMELLSEPDWTVFKVIDHIPTDEEVEEGLDAVPWADDDEPLTN